MTHLTDKIVKIRKPHMCFLCERKFDIGQRMRYSSGIWDNNWWQGYECLTCKEIIALSPRDDFEDGIPQGYVTEGCEGSTPEEYLERLRNEK